MADEMAVQLWPHKIHLSSFGHKWLRAGQSGGQRNGTSKRSAMSQQLGSNNEQRKQKRLRPTDPAPGVGAVDDHAAHAQLLGPLKDEALGGVACGKKGRAPTVKQEYPRECDGKQRLNLRQKTMRAAAVRGLGWRARSQHTSELWCPFGWHHPKHISEENQPRPPPGWILPSPTGVLGW